MTKRHCHGWPPARIPLLAILAVCLAASRSRAEDRRDRIGKGPPPPPAVTERATAPHVEAATPAIAPDVVRVATIRTALNPLLIRDRRHRLLLLRGDEALASGETSDALAHFQALLNAPQDAFSWKDDSTQLLGTQADVLDNFQTLPADVRELYELHHGPAARELLTRFGESGDQRLLLDLCRRFGHTIAARDAAVEQLLLARDAGRAALSAEWRRLLTSDAYHWSRLPDHVRQIILRQERESPSQGPQQGPQQDHTQENITPPYPVPLWSARFDSHFTETDTAAPSPDDQQEATVGETIANSIDQWLADRIEDRLPIASANEAVIADGTLIVRDFAHLSAFHLTTGRRLWTYDCRASLAALALEQTGHPANKSNPGSLDFDALFAGNPVFGRLTTDGSRVFLLDQVDAPTTNASTTERESHRSSSPPPHRPNQLVALDIEAPRPAPTFKVNGRVSRKRPLWTRGTQSTHTDDPLAWHNFLGRPLCCDDRLFILAEFEGQISLIALESQTGRTLWKQAVALVGRAAAVDSLRTRTASSPLYADGIVICPTEVGVVVGVDALTGRLQWAYDHLDEDQRTNSGRWAFATGRKSDRLPLPSHSFVHNGQFVHLPRRSESVHCIDARTGAGLWNAPRLDSYAIGGLTNDAVLLLGDRECRALSLNENGQQLWRTSIPEPAGRGLVAAHHYYLPTADGPCLSLNLRTGQIEGRPFHQLLYEVARHPQAHGLRPVGPRPILRSPLSALGSPAGNLIATDELIVAATPVGISVFTQARPALDQLETTAKTTAPSMGDRLKQAELELALGDRTAARRTLADLLNQSTITDVRPAAERLLREILYAEVEQSDRPHELLDQIAALCRSDEQRLRLLMRRIDVAISTEDPQLLVDALQQFQSIPPTGLMPQGDGYFVAPSMSVWARLARLRKRGEEKGTFCFFDSYIPSSQRVSTEKAECPLFQSVAAHVATSAGQLIETADSEQLEQFVTLFAGWEAAAPARTRLARLWTATGRHQEAESLLLSERFSDCLRAGGEKQHALAPLYAQNGLPPILDDGLGGRGLRGGRAEGGEQRAENHAPGLPVGPAPATRKSSDGTALAARNPHDDVEFALIPSARVALRTASLRSPHSALNSPTVEITQFPTEEECSGIDARRLYGSVRHRIFPHHSRSLVVLDRGPVGDDRTRSLVAIADRDRCTIRAEIEVPSAYWPEPHALSTDNGHVMVIGGETAFGLSLLEGRLLWSLDAPRTGKKADKFKVGPLGPDYCILQTDRDLRAVHPATGQTLWLRTDLPPGVGLQDNDTTGVIGDSQTLAVFDDDQTAFTRYHTLTGRKLARDVRTLTDGATRRGRWAVRRRLVELVSTPTGSRLQVWDSRDNRIEWDIPLTDRLFCPLPGDREFACVTADRRLQILNVAEERLCVDIPLPEPAAEKRGHSALLGESSDANGNQPRKKQNVPFFHALTVFADSQRYYVNLVDDRPPVRRGGRPTGAVAAEDHLSFPKVRVRGRLLAIDRRTQTIAWDRRVDDACVPLREEGQSEMLVLIREGEKRGHSAFSGETPSTERKQPPKKQNVPFFNRQLIVEVLDASTGETLSLRSGLDLAPFVDCTLNDVPPADTGLPGVRLTLRGCHSHVAITLIPGHRPPLIRTASQDADSLIR